MAGKELDYICILRALDEIPFGVGRKLLVEFLQGKEGHESIARNKLDQLEHFGCLAYDTDELTEVIDNLQMNGLIQSSSVDGKRFWKVLALTEKGRREIDEPTLYKKKISYNFNEADSIVTDEDKKIFEALGDILKDANDKQKKAIISPSDRILCIAGAGTGKTSVLTKRIDFLVKYRSADPSKILAITFTRKARQEMQRRLESLGGLEQVNVETFNSFCEKVLREHESKVYDKPTRVIEYKDKITMVIKGLESQNLDMRKAIAIYFSGNQRRSKTDDQLANILINDCFFVRDYFRFKKKKIATQEQTLSAKMVFSIVKFIDEYMGANGLRDFADQLMDTLKLFFGDSKLIPKFEHLLIDEYQDVNDTQIQLAETLAPSNLFCVGDPRQSIFGWRGSDVGYILNFKKNHLSAQAITLTQNYRSTTHIVHLANESLKTMGLPDLEATIDGENGIELLKCSSEEHEADRVINMILDSRVPKEEIFVLARTNRQLNELSRKMKARKIPHIVRSDEMRRLVVASEGEVTLATVHAIKGMEAELVFVLGCNSANFPCKGSEHPVIEMIKVDEYDKEEEERRLFYVAISRAKNRLVMTYTGKKPTSFITESMMKGITGQKEAIPKEDIHSTKLFDRLKEWRKELAVENEIPAYLIMHDRTIIDLVQNNPVTSEDLQEITGLGPTKISKYGEDILRIVNDG